MAARSKKLDSKGLWLRGNTYWLAATIPGQGRVRVSLNTSDLAEAIAAARKIKSEPRRLKEPTMDGYIATLKRRGISPRRLETIEIVIPLIMREINCAEIHKITTPALQRWLDRPEEIRIKQSEGEDKILKKQSPATLATYMGVLSRYFQWLIDHGRVRLNPCADLRLPRVPPARRLEFLTPEQAKLCLDSCDDPGLKFCLYAGLHAGLRKAEVVACRPSWFDMKAGLLHVQNEDDFTVKDRDNRTIPLTEEFKTFLQGYGFHEPFMLKPEVKKGSHRYRYDFRVPFENHMERLKLKFTFHDLRRTFASLLVSAGVSPYKVGKWLGDGIAVVERHYGHLLPNDDEINKSWTRKEAANAAQ